MLLGDDICETAGISGNDRCLSVNIVQRGQGWKHRCRFQFSFAEGGRVQLRVSADPSLAPGTPLQTVCTALQTGLQTVLQTVRVSLQTVQTRRMGL